MGSAASVERMDREALAAEAERNRFPAAVCAKIIEKDIDGATALEYADLPEDDMTALAKEFFDSVADRGKVKGALKKLGIKVPVSKMRQLFAMFVARETHTDHSAPSPILPLNPVPSAH